MYTTTTFYSPPLSLPPSLSLSSPLSLSLFPPPLSSPSPSLSFSFTLQCQWVVAAIRQLHCLAKGMFNSRHGHRDQQQIADLQKQYDLLRVTAATLSKLVNNHNTLHTCNTVVTIGNHNTLHTCNTVVTIGNHNTLHTCNTVVTIGNHNTLHTCNTVVTIGNTLHTCNTVVTIGNTLHTCTCTLHTCNTVVTIGNTGANVHVHVAVFISCDKSHLYITYIHVYTVE